MKSKVVLILWLLNGILLTAPAQNKQVTIHVHFDSSVPADVTVVPAILKYNKDFAFSFTFDDSRSDAYGLGYKLLTGGSPADDGNTYPGFFYTDGCGNRIPFRAGIAWITANSDFVDLHWVTPSYLTYAEAIEMYHGGWDFFNHGYNHASGSDTINYLRQLTDNELAFRKNTGIGFSYCIPPSGDLNYVKPAFELGYSACFSSVFKKPGYEDGVDVIPSVPAEPVFFRHLIASDVNTLDSLSKDMDQFVANTGPGRQRWWNEFTHRIEYPYINASMEFPEFKGYMSYLESKFGAGGKDNGWFAGSGEVFEYLMVRDKVMVSLQKNGPDLDISLDYSKIPGNFRYYNLSLMVNGAAQVQSVDFSGPGKVTHAQTNRGHLINIDLPDSQFSGIDIIENQFNDQLKGFPNPVRGTYFLVIPKTINAPEITISNMLSETMPLPPVKRGEGLISLDFSSVSYPRGVYCIRVAEHGRLIGFSKVIIDNQQP